jgi:transposase
MIPCQNYQQATTTKNGFVRNKPRDKCQACGDNFVLGDARHTRSTELQKALSIMLYALGKASCGFLAKRFGVSRTTTYYWIRQAAAMPDAPTIDAAMQALDFDEMWHCMQSKKETSGFVKPWIVVQGALVPGCAVVVMLQHSNGFTTKCNM